MSDTCSCDDTGGYPCDYCVGKLTEFKADAILAFEAINPEEWSDGCGCCADGDLSSDANFKKLHTLIEDIKKR